MTGPSEPIGWCTNWDAYDIDALLSMVAGEDDPRGWDQTGTWRAMEESVRAARDRLDACKRSLQELWPPEKSPAAREFVARIDALTANMREASVAATRNMVGLEGVMTALADAKRRLESLAAQHKDASGDWIPSFVDNAEEELTKQAREVLDSADRAASQHAANLVPIPRYLLSMSGIDGGTSPSSPTERGRPGNSGAVAEPGAPRVHEPPASLPGISPVMPDGQGWTGGSSGAAGAPVGGGLSLVGVTPTTGVPGVPPGGGSLPGTGTPIPGTGAGSGGTGPWGVPGGMLPPGGVIAPGGARGGAVRGGGAPPAGAGRAGLPRQPMPGGVIGGPPAGRTGAATGGAAGRGSVGSRPGMAGTAPLGAAGGRRAPGDSDERGGHGDPDNPWEVAEGVPPVIGPPAPAPRPDPGPGVIGMDR